MIDCKAEGAIPVALAIALSSGSCAVQFLCFMPMFTGITLVASVTFVCVKNCSERIVVLGSIPILCVEFIGTDSP